MKRPSVRPSVRPSLTVCPWLFPSSDSNRHRSAGNAGSVALTADVDPEQRLVFIGTRTPRVYTG